MASDTSDTSLTLPPCSDSALAPSDLDPCHAYPSPAAR